MTIFVDIFILYLHNLFRGRKGVSCEDGGFLLLIITREYKGSFNGTYILIHVDKTCQYR